MSTYGREQPLKVGLGDCTDKDPAEKGKKVQKALPKYNARAMLEKPGASLDI